MSQNKLIKRRIKKFAKNQCVICPKKSTCKSPLHGKFSAKTGDCPDASLVSEKEAMLWALKDVNGLSDAQCAEFFRRAHEDGRL